MDVADLKEAFQNRMYSMLMEPRVIDAFRDLLQAKDKVLRHKAWELALKHAAPVTKEGDEGPARVIVNMHIPRPEKNITPEGKV